MNTILSTLAGILLAPLRIVRLGPKKKQKTGSTAVDPVQNAEPAEPAAKPPHSPISTDMLNDKTTTRSEPAPPSAVEAEAPSAEARSTPPEVDVSPESHDVHEDELEASKMHAADAALDSNVGEVRVYHDPQGVYLLPADDGELSRLTLQHHLITIHMDHKLVLAPIEWAEGDEVLDSGTGTGSWTLDTQPRVPAFVRFVGVDISPRLFPAPANTPPNASFVQGSSTALPADWTDRFALVNQRMLLGGFTKAMWPLALGEFFRVLKPGGWAQLTEATMHAGGPATARHIAIMRAMFAARALDIDIAAPGVLVRLFEAAGFVNVTEVRRPARLGAWAGELGALGRRNVVAGYRAMKAPIVASGLGAAGGVHTEVEYEQLMDDMSQELDVTEGSGMDWVCVYAQKPVAA